MTGLPLGGARARVAVMDDEPHVLSTSLRENLRLARPGCDDAAIEDALARAGLGDWLAGLPDGLRTMLGAGHRGLSGGERARLALARVVLSGRPVWLLDEPLAHLDHATAVAVLRDCLAAADELGASVVVVSHQVDEVADLRTLIPGR